MAICRSRRIHYLRSPRLARTAFRFCHCRGRTRRPVLYHDARPHATDRSTADHARSGEPVDHPIEPPGDGCDRAQGDFTLTVSPEGMNLPRPIGLLPAPRPPEGVPEGSVPAASLPERETPPDIFNGRASAARAQTGAEKGTGGTDRHRPHREDGDRELGWK